MFDWIITNWDNILTVATTAVALAAAVTAMTPSPEDDNWVKKVRGWLNKAAFNFGHAENKGE